jgi:hypothetical protein
VLVTPLLFSGVGSGVVALEMVTMLSYVVPSGVPEGICAVRIKFPLAPAGQLAIVHDTVPPLPTAGVVQLQPAGGDRLTKVSVPGSGSDTVTDAAASGPTLRAVSV